MLPLLLLPDARAGVWSFDDLPVAACVAEDSVPSVGPGYPAEAIQGAFDAWAQAAPCTRVGGVVTEGCPAGDVAWQQDGSDAFTFGDPAGTVPAGVLAETRCWTSAGSETSPGRYDERTVECDVVFNDGVDWTTDAAIDAGECDGQYSLRSAATHEIGHVFGLRDICEDGGPCDPLSSESTMVGWQAPCNDDRSTLDGGTDAQLLGALYGTHFLVDCDRTVADTDEPWNEIAVGNVPFDLRCVASYEPANGADTVTWRWGDGETSTGTRVAHTYDDPGQYRVEADLTGFDECPDFVGRARPVAYVRACGVPEAVFGVVRVDDLTWQLRNDTDLSVPGCVDDVAWDVFAADGSRVAELTDWEPQLTLPAEGDYRVVLNVGGPAGTGAAEVTLHTRACGCDHGGAGGGAVAMLVASVAACRRRRRGM